MRTLKYFDMSDFADAYYTKSMEGRCISFYTGYDGAVAFTKLLLQYDDVVPYSIEMESYEVGGYSREYCITLFDDGNLYVEKAWHEARDFEDYECKIKHREAGYYIDESDVIYIDSYVYPIQSDGKIDAKVTYVIEFDYPYDEYDHDSDDENLFLTSEDEVGSEYSYEIEEEDDDNSNEHLRIAIDELCSVFADHLKESFERLVGLK